MQVCEGDRVIVDVINMLHADSTTIHWHGQHLRQNPYMDGTPFISQCPILPGETFRYDFIAATPGSHFWHSHIGFQRGDGLFGALIVRRAPKVDQLRNLYDYDEHHMIVSDWDHEMGLVKFLGHYHGNGDNKPPNVIINGLGRFGNRTQREGPLNHMLTATFNVKKNYRYRLRIINAEFLNCPIEMSIDNHTMLVASSDGKDVDPIEADSLVTYAGERFDVIVEMNQEIGNYWIRFRGLLDCAPKFTKAYQVAILRYEGAPHEDPKADVAYEIPYNEDITKQVNPFNKGTEAEDSVSIPHLQALDKNSEANVERDPDYQFYISYDFYGKDSDDYHRKGLYGYREAKHKTGMPQLNHISMKMPTFPLMSQTGMIDSRHFCNDSTVKGCDTEYCACPHVLQVKLNSLVELVLVDEGVPYDANHPFHLHGHDFRVMAIQRLGSNTTAEDVRRADREGRIKRRFDRAPIKDTVTVPDGGFTIIRFHASNPGYWLFHCHIEFHSEVGMSLVFKVGEHEDFAQVPEGFPRCGNYKPSKDNRSKIKTTTTTMASGSLDDKVGENEVEDHRVDEKVRSSIANWLPLILNELRAASSAAPVVEVTLACMCVMAFAFVSVL
ncbi:laccase-1-like [Copidosoma floridanum]|uniref:laccase-1-like n=1 Tax=Copidosoma floridanum TaxID=29053 RepID=UPI0006C9E1A8|nr:laccase-1-like [Copidosoma floridanum]